MKKTVIILSAIIILWNINSNGKGKTIKTDNTNDYNRINVSALHFIPENIEIMPAAIKQNNIAYEFCKMVKSPNPINRFSYDTVENTYFDGQGRLTEKSGYFLDTKWQLFYTYDSLGLQKEMSYYFFNNRNCYSANYYYNKTKGQLLQIWTGGTVDSDNVVTDHFVNDTSVYNFNKQGYLISSVVYDVTHGFNYKARYYYNAYNLLIKEERTYFGGEKNAVTTSNLFYTGTILDSAVTKFRCHDCEGFIPYDSKTRFDKKGLLESKSELHDSARFVYGYRRFEN
jgi:hypothetical protein